MGGFVFEIYPARNESDLTTAIRFGFSVDNVDSVVKALSVLGSTIRTSPADTEWGRRAVVHDLDGHIVELTTPLNRENRVIADYQA